MKFLFLAVPLLLAAQSLEARCAEELQPEYGGEDVNYPPSAVVQPIFDILREVRSEADIDSAAEKVYCHLVGLKLGGTYQAFYLGDSIGDLDYSLAREAERYALAAGFARYQNALEEIGRQYDADSVSFFIFTDMPELIDAYLEELNTLGDQTHTRWSLAKVTQVRKLANYNDYIQRIETLMKDLFAGEIDEPNIRTVLSAIQKDEERAVRFFKEQHGQKFGLYAMTENETTQNLRIVHGEPWNVVSSRQPSHYDRAVAAFEGREYIGADKFTVECRFPADTVVSIGNFYQVWEYEFVSYQDRKLVLECDLVDG